MSKKRILIVFPGALFPKVMACQDRVIGMIGRLSRDHSIDLAFIYKNDEEVHLSRKRLRDFCDKIIPIRAINARNNYLGRAYYRIKNGIIHSAKKTPLPFLYLGNNRYLRRLQKIIDEGNYSVVQLEYCHMGGILRHLGKNIVKVIDTHMIAYKEQELYYLNQFGHILPTEKRKEIDRYKQIESRVLNDCDVSIGISNADVRDLKAINPNNQTVLIYTGQDINFYRTFARNPEPGTILFYGCMEGKQNILAFFRVYDQILPFIKKRLKEYKVLVVGANPPDSVKKLHDNKSIIVTGYVDDVRGYLSKSSVMLIPLDVGVGFRSRVVEVLAMGIPVVGTYNALGNLEITHGVHGFITDSNEEMADYTCKILADRVLQQRMSRECVRFALNNFDIESTYGKLSLLYSEL
jgi:glycosyltransferase involved in cell wall biosynthesis